MLVKQAFVCGQSLGTQKKSLACDNEEAAFVARRGQLSYYVKKKKKRIQSLQGVGVIVNLQGAEVTTKSSETQH